MARIMLKYCLRFIPNCIIFIILILIFINGNAYAKSPESLKVEAQRYYWGKRVNQDLRKALQLYEQAAQMGDPEAEYIAGGMYFTGKGTKPNFQRAFALLTRAAEKGHSSPEAQEALAQIYLAGEIVPQNLVKAKELFELAAGGGKKEAQNELGFMYFVGNGVERDFNKALYWFEKAAQQGLAMAQYNVGMMYYSGSSDKGVDLVKSHAWLNLAGSSGHQGARSTKEHVEPMLSDEELQASQELSSKLYQTIKK